MQPIIDFIWNNWGSVATILFLISELLGSIDSVKSSSIFQFLVNILQKLRTPKI
jgi:hypothetical protein